MNTYSLAAAQSQAQAASSFNPAQQQQQQQQRSTFRAAPPAASQQAVALQGQNKGQLYTGQSIASPSPSMPLARSVQRMAPVPRPVAVKRCASCS